MRLSNLRESPLIRMAEEARRPTSWWLSYVVFLIVGLGVTTIGVTMLLSVVMPAKEGSFLGHAQEALTFGLGLAFVALWLRFYEGRGFSSVGFRGRGGIVKLGIGILIGAGMNIAAAVIDMALGGYTFTASAPDPGLGLPVVALVVVSLGIVIVQASGEEVWFRGFILQSNARALPGIVAVVLPAVVFWAVHGITDPFGIVNVIMFAIFAAVIVLRQGSLWLAAGIHTGWNWFMGNVLGAPVSGIAPREVTLFTLTPVADAPSYAANPSLGIEGTIGCTIVWMVSLVIAFLYFRSGSTSQA